MTPQIFAIIGLRLLAIYFIVDSISLFGEFGIVAAFATQLNPPHALIGVITSLIPGVIQLVAGLLLFALSPKISERIAPRVPDNSLSASYALQDWQAIAFAAAGLVILTNALPRLGSVFESLYYLSVSQPIRGGFSSGAAFGVFVQFAIGLVLVFSPRVVGRFWHWMRTAGTNPPSDSN